jgi:hypothetical protein
MEDNTHKFVGSDGEFKSTVDIEPGKVNIAYLMEMLEWIYYHNNMTDEYKLKYITDVEDMIQHLLDNMNIGLNTKYERTWSAKLKGDINHTVKNKNI